MSFDEKSFLFYFWFLARPQPKAKVFGLLAGQALAKCDMIFCVCSFCFKSFLGENTLWTIAESLKVLTVTFSFGSENTSKKVFLSIRRGFLPLCLSMSPRIICLGFVLTQNAFFQLDFFFCVHLKFFFVRDVQVLKKAGVLRSWRIAAS